MNVRITTVDGEAVYTCTRYMTDEANNLVVFDGDSLRAVYSADCWRSAVTEED